MTYEIVHNILLSKELYKIQFCTVYMLYMYLHLYTIYKYIYLYRNILNILNIETYLNRLERCIPKY